MSTIIASVASIYWVVDHQTITVNRRQGLTQVSTPQNHCLQQSSLIDKLSLLLLLGLTRNPPNYSKTSHLAIEHLLTL
jgi:hypothetical protein